MANRYTQLNRHQQAAEICLEILTKNGWNGGTVLTDEMLELLGTAHTALTKLAALIEADQLQEYYDSLEESEKADPEEISRIAGKAISDFAKMQQEKANLRERGTD